ncbi:O-antigen polymerase [Photobacterium sanguinicancri]|uniref:O-antigen polymerase n=1 Tax=Photobacterium sanguinicancri TaxID=875932 RepID=A0AAW7Y3X9_9GAMM|nr:O-antigen polymerase [Photobacterium sanguinicancri]MDO6542471.1 O-antigen polymerase [Photobacterium sanguinicancri]
MAIKSALSFFIIFTLFCMLPYIQESVSIIYFTLFLVVLYLHFLGYKLGDPQVLILMGVIFFNARPFLDVVFDSETFGDTHGFFKSGSFDVEHIGGSIIYIKLSIMAFLIGMFRLDSNAEQINNSIFLYHTKSYYKEFFVFLLIPTILACSSLIFLCTLNGGYAYFNSGSTLVSILRRFIPLLTVCMTLNLIFYKEKFITYILITICLSISILIGARLIGLMPIICLMVFCSFKHKDKYNKYFPIIALCLVMFTVLVNFFRAGNVIGTDVDYMFFVKFFLNEISFTSNLIPMAFEYTEVNGFTYGINYLGAIAATVPKLAFWMTVSDGTYSFSSALGMFYDPVAISKGLGLNGSMLGESYFSFGYFGLIVIFFISFSLRWLFNKTTSNIIWLYFILSASPYLLTMFIFESTIVTRGIVYYSLIPIFVFFVFIRKFSRVKK